ncbi:TIGR03809 family protein [Bradyrhizobium sp. 24]|uniref:TIGR03809 family protein n=1 Tax=unclassified Bradyrhizobium TaxID=2631580 RepID=UPI001FF81379|nr:MULTISPECIES: TIGR03809 family protein [unclassified Bradyrhizobium]MCK1302450.1 TIGR03809 family protein [Bradyrhizobium sp. 37]MCK1382154.1 TIGR03809 family protein [Bradyrhizobium sp. 24]MCK1774634.1 TIGR03809 family protein [Bradyrhizobium sp. 134]
MTHRQEAIRDVAIGRDVAARWCALAEQRLVHLSEMFETGRWRRYHSEIAFLENIQEAKLAVQTWRALATGADVATAAASVSPAFGWSPATMPRMFPREPQAQTVQPKAVHIAPETAVPVRLDPKPGVLAEITEAPTAPVAAPAPMAPLRVPAAMAPPTAPVVMTGPKVPASPKALAAMVALLPQFSPPAAEIVAAPERLVEFTFSLDGLEAKYPLLRNAF